MEALRSSDATHAGSFNVDARLTETSNIMANVPQMYTPYDPTQLPMATNSSTQGLPSFDVHNPWYSTNTMPSRPSESLYEHWSFQGTAEALVAGPTISESGNIHVTSFNYHDPAFATSNPTVSSSVPPSASGMQPTAHTDMFLYPVDTPVQHFTPTHGIHGISLLNLQYPPFDPPASGLRAGIETDYAPMPGNNHSGVDMTPTLLESDFNEMSVILQRLLGDTATSQALDAHFRQCILEHVTSRIPS